MNFGEGLDSVESLISDLPKIKAERFWLWSNIPSHFFKQAFWKTFCGHGTSVALFERGHITGCIKNREIAESTKNCLKASSSRKTCGRGKKSWMIMISDHLYIWWNQSAEKQNPGLCLKRVGHSTIFRNLVNTDTHCTSKSSLMYYYNEFCTWPFHWKWVKTMLKWPFRPRRLSRLLTAVSRDLF